MPDKAIDVIDEAAAAQNLLPPSRRRQTIGQKEVEATIATMARIPAKHVSRDDKAILASLEDDLKRMVFGQDAWHGIRRPWGGPGWRGWTGRGVRGVCTTVAKKIHVALARSAT